MNYTGINLSLLGWIEQDESWRYGGSYKDFQEHVELYKKCGAKNYDEPNSAWQCCAIL